MILKHFLLVGLGGMAGSVLRYAFSLFIKHNSFPYATLVVNIVGSLVIGVVMGIASKQSHFGDWRLFLATGICGGFTTFSALSWECLQMLQQNRYYTAAFYIVISVLLGLMAVVAGYSLTK